MLTVTGGLFAGATAIAQEGAAASPGGYSVQLGNGRNASRAGLSWETAPWWGSAGEAREGRWSAVTELGAARWAAHGDRAPASVWQVSVTPLVRYGPASLPGLFLEAGIGASVFRHTHFADDAISTAFQFGDHLGVGYQVTAQHRISLRLSHYSNAGIKSPNPGLTVLQLSYTYLP
ncbi:acyloxyacyl hydrolase [Curvibacter sp. HBC28]|uniref:Lipid A deacylase n=1 Tax=Curvibacter microcysteis TaxID=3026419 RepID=A0ABT5MEK2_9BURK|nr:acyloxyacyl hydrolase [Curvibacter sp. HBC28]MDD0814304.1 acyloxyacyl hydrolase [Curvibacter sp. HBC28]